MGSKFAKADLSDINADIIENVREKSCVEEKLRLRIRQFQELDAGWSNK